MLLSYNNIGSLIRMVIGSPDRIFGVLPASLPVWRSGSRKHVSELSHPVIVLQVKFGRILGQSLLENRVGSAMHVLCM